MTMWEVFQAAKARKFLLWAATEERISTASDIVAVSHAA